MSHDYKLKYEFNTEPGNFTADQIKESGKGGADALLLSSVIYPSDGSFSMTFFTVDGRNEGNELSSIELFKIWMLMGQKLSQREDLDLNRQKLASLPMQIFMESRQLNEAIETTAEETETKEQP